MSSEASKPAAADCSSLNGMGGGGGLNGMKLEGRMCWGKASGTVRAVACASEFFAIFRVSMENSPPDRCRDNAVSRAPTVFERVLITCDVFGLFGFFMNIVPNASSETFVGQLSVTEIGRWREKNEDVDISLSLRCVVLGTLGKFCAD